MNPTRYVLAIAGTMLLFGLLSGPAWGDPHGKEGKSKGENIEFTFGEVVVKCAKTTDQYKIFLHIKSVPNVGHPFETIFYEECEAVGVGKIEDFECGLEFKPLGTASFTSSCTININCCLIKILGQTENQELHKVAYSNIKEKEPFAYNIEGTVSGITYETEGPCIGLKIAKKASNGTYTDPETEEGSFFDGIQCTGVTGSGSNLQATLQAADTKQLKTTCEVAPTAEYKATSNAKALKEWGSEKGALNAAESGNGSTLDEYIASDLPPEKGQMERMDTAGKGKEHGSETETSNGIVVTPVAQSAVAVLVSLRAGCMANTLDTPRVEDLGLEEEWFANKGTLEALVKNGGIMSCSTSETPKLIVRSDPSSATAGFKRFFNGVKTGWTKYAKPLKVAAGSEWPSTVSRTGEGGEGEAKTVYNTPNSMGYADLADAKAAGFTAMPVLHKNGSAEYYSFYVEVQNSEKEAKYASSEVTESEAAASNCKAATYTEPEGGAGVNKDWSEASESNSLGGTTYPICTLTYDLAWHHYQLLGKEILLQEEYTGTVLDYFEWILKTGQETQALKRDHFAPLPSGMDEKASKAVSEDIDL